MTNSDLEERLLGIPAEIEEAEQAVFEAQRLVDGAKRALMMREDALLLDDMEPLKGANAEIRAAKLRRATGDDRDRLAAVERGLRYAQIELHTREREFSALRAVAALRAARTAE